MFWGHKIQKFPGLTDWGEQHIPRHIPIFRSTDGVLDMMTYHLGACNAHYDSGRTMDGCEVLYILHYCSNIYKPEFGIA